MMRELRSLVNPSFTVKVGLTAISDDARIRNDDEKLSWNAYGMSWNVYEPIRSFILVTLVYGKFSFKKLLSYVYLFIYSLIFK